jgi:NAD+ synthase (glutamine-hydrolysing)
MISKLRIAMVQLNPSIGNVIDNTTMIIDYINQARQKSVDIIIFPELSITGYTPQDQLHYHTMKKNIQESIELIKSNSFDIAVIVGAPIALDPNSIHGSYERYHNSALVIQDKEIRYQVDKMLIPNYDVFNEYRYFTPGDEPRVIEIMGMKIGLQICEDMWDHLPFYDKGCKISEIQTANGAEIVINLSASPFSLCKPGERLDIVKNHVKINKVPFIYLNEVGGHDELVFDGRSFIVNSDGKMVFLAPAYEEGMFIYDLSDLDKKIDEQELLSSYLLNKNENIISSIRLNLSDYLRKIKFDNKLVIGLSGGIDSALTAALCTMAVGKERVVGVIMSSRYSSGHSITDAKELADALEIEILEFPIDKLHSAFENSLMDNLNIDLNEKVLADENIQSRLRSNILMYLSNRYGYIVITTGNKSEIATGYFTLYGDSAGGKNLIGDLYKYEVYDLARYINEKYPDYRIPDGSINKPPSAELKEDQKDSDSLPDYPILDKILFYLVEERMSSDAIVAKGFDEEIVKKIVGLVQINEFKRSQLVQTVKIQEHTYGIGHAKPVATSFRP